MPTIHEDSRPKPSDVTVVLDLRNQPEAWAKSVCGLSVALRALLTFQHAGVKRAVLVGDRAQEVSKEAAAAPYHRLHLECSSDVPPPTNAPRIVVESPVVLSSAAVKVLAEKASFAGLRLPGKVEPTSVDFLVDASTPTGRRRAGQLIRRSCRKPVEFSGIMSALFKQSIVLQMTRLVCRLPVTPNAVTVFALFVGLAAIPFYLDGSYLGAAIGGAILFVNNLFDILDGQIARMKFRFSSFGERLDNLVDGVVNVAILAPIGIGLHKGTGYVGWEVMGWIGSLGALSYLLMVEYYSWRKGLSGYSTNMQFWYRLDKSGVPKRPPTHTAPKTGIRRYLVPKYFMRKDFLFTMYLVFGLFGWHMVPFTLMVLGNLEYGLISWVQVLFFHDRIQFAGTHRGTV